MALEPRFQGFVPPVGTTWAAISSPPTWQIRNNTNPWGTPGSVGNVIVNTAWGISSAGVIIKQTPSTEAVVTQIVNMQLVSPATMGYAWAQRIYVNTNGVDEFINGPDVPLGTVAKDGIIDIQAEMSFSRPGVAVVRYYGTLFSNPFSTAVCTVVGADWTTTVADVLT